VGTREYLRHIEAKTHGLTKKNTLASYLREGSPYVLGVAKRGRKGHMSAIEEEVLIGTVMIADRINDGDVRNTVLEKGCHGISRNRHGELLRLMLAKKAV